MGNEKGSFKVMPKKHNKFVTSKINVVTPDETLVDKQDVGIIMSETSASASVFFIRIWKVAELSREAFEVIDVKKTGDEYKKKICNICHKLRKTSEFAKNQNAKNNRSVRRPSCQKCRKAIEGFNMGSSSKTKWLKKKPTNEPFECPICKKRTIAGVTSKVVLEHDHRTGKVGGWICDSCNTGLGRFKDDVGILKSAIDFLKRNY